MLSLLKFAESVILDQNLHTDIDHLLVTYTNDDKSNHSNLEEVTTNLDAGTAPDELPVTLDEYKDIGDSTIKVTETENYVNEYDPLYLQEWPSFIWEKTNVMKPLPPIEKLIQKIRQENNVILYYIHSRYCVDNNDALNMAVWLANKLKVPIIAMVDIDEDSLQDIAQSYDSNSNNPSVTVTTKNPCFVPLKSCAQQSFERKSIQYMSALLSLYTQLNQKNIPLFGVCYQASSLHNQLFASTTTCTSVSTTAPSSSSSAKSTLLPMTRSLDMLLSHYNILCIFTDDNSDPLHMYQCHSVHRYYPDIPLFMIDTDSLLPLAHLRQSLDIMNKQSYNSRDNASLQEDKTSTTLSSIQRDWQLFLMYFWKHISNKVIDYKSIDDVSAETITQGKLYINGNFCHDITKLSMYQHMMDSNTLSTYKEHFLMIIDWNHPIFTTIQSAHTFTSHIHTTISNTLISSSYSIPNYKSSSSHSNHQGTPHSIGTDNKRRKSNTYERSRYSIDHYITILQEIKYYQQCILDTTHGYQLLDYIITMIHTFHTSGNQPTTPSSSSSSSLISSDICISTTCTESHTNLTDSYSKCEWDGTICMYIGELLQHLIYSEIIPLRTIIHRILSSCNCQALSCCMMNHNIIQTNTNDIQMNISRDKNTPYDKNAYCLSVYLLEIMAHIEFSKWMVVDKRLWSTMMPNETDIYSIAHTNNIPEIPWFSLLPMNIHYDIRCIEELLFILRSTYSAPTTTNISQTTNTRMTGMNSQTTSKSSQTTSSTTRNTMIYPTQIRTGNTGNSLFDIIQYRLLLTGLLPIDIFMVYYIAYMMLVSTTPEMGLRVTIIEFITHCKYLIPTRNTFITNILMIVATKVMPLLFQLIEQLCEDVQGFGIGGHNHFDPVMKLIELLELNIRQKVGDIVIDKYIHENKIIS